MRLPLARFRHGCVLLAAILAFGCGHDSLGETTAERNDAIDLRVDGGVAAEAGGDRTPPLEPTRLRVVAANLTSGSQQSYDAGDGVRILQALAPDVVLLQEFNYGTNDAADLRAFVDQTFGTSFTYTRAPAQQIPNGVVSRYPIVASGAWTDPQTATRDFSWARIDVPGDHDLWAVSVHFLTSNSSRRQAEAAAVVARVRAEIPESDYLVVGGDLNTGSSGEACLRTLGSVVRTTGPFPVDSSNNPNTNSSRRDPLDWVLADADLDRLEVPVVAAGITFSHGLVFDSRVFRPLGEVPPVRAGDSAAENMQHMAVVRDFALPAN